MPIKKKPIKRTVSEVDVKALVSQITPSELNVVDIPLELLLGHDLNPNEMSEDKFDELVEGIRKDGFDEPIQVVPHPKREGYYLIAGGHHRVKAAKRIGLKKAPAVIKTGWSEDEAKIALVRRNILKGKMNNSKFTSLYTELAKTYDVKLLQAMLGFTEKKEFEAVYENVATNLPAPQRKALAKAKEKIKSVDDLSSVLNTIFKEAGSQVDEGYVVFTFGGKDHHYIAVDDDTNERLKALKKAAEDGGISPRDFLKSIIAQATPAPSKKATKRRIVKRNG